jgi:Neuraminidase (sialidase)
LNLTGPPVENSDIYYRRCRDADATWSNEVWLSRGLLYCYAPTIAAEGDKVVVAWAGIRNAGKYHSEYGPNDIYYVTSKDGGKTWTPPLKVTDGAKDGATAGMPQVALSNGTIHLVYIQGARRTAQELSPGLTKLGEEPWPLYHQHRPFPD